jgi:hypothetical protein
MLDSAPDSVLVVDVDTGDVDTVDIDTGDVDTVDIDTKDGTDGDMGIAVNVAVACVATGNIVAGLADSGFGLAISILTTLKGCRGVVNS